MAELLVANGQVGDDEEEPDLLNEDQRALWDALPKQFIKKEAIRVAQKVGVKNRTLDNYLNLFLRLGILNHRNRGSYSKKQ